MATFIWTRWLTCPLLCTLGVLVQTLQFLDKVFAVPVVVATGAHGFRRAENVVEVPQMQFSFGDVPGDHAALMAVCMAMGRLMGAGRDPAAVFALLEVVWS